MDKNTSRKQGLRFNDKAFIQAMKELKEKGVDVSKMKMNEVMEYINNNNK